MLNQGKLPLRLNNSATFSDSHIQEENAARERQVGMMVVVDKIQCVGCEECIRVCPTMTIIMKIEKAEIIQKDCNQCGQCILICPIKAIKRVSKP